MVDEMVQLQLAEDDFLIHWDDAQVQGRRRTWLRADVEGDESMDVFLIHFS